MTMTSAHPVYDPEQVLRFFQLGNEIEWAHRWIYQSSIMERTRQFESFSID